MQNYAKMTTGEITPYDVITQDRELSALFSEIKDMIYLGTGTWHHSEKVPRWPRTDGTARLRTDDIAGVTILELKL